MRKKNYLTEIPPDLRPRINPQEALKTIQQPEYVKALVENNHVAPHTDQGIITTPNYNKLQGKWRDFRDSETGKTLSWIPPIGVTMNAIDFADAAKSGDNLRAAINAGFLFLPQALKGGKNLLNGLKSIKKLANPILNSLKAGKQVPALVPQRNLNNIAFSRRKIPQSNPITKTLANPSIYKTDLDFKNAIDKFVEIFPWYKNDKEVLENIGYEKFKSPFIKYNNNWIINPGGKLLQDPNISDAIRWDNSDILDAYMASTKPYNSVNLGSLNPYKINPYIDGYKTSPSKAAEKIFEQQVLPRYEIAKQKFGDLPQAFTDMNDFRSKTKDKIYKLDLDKFDLTYPDADGITDIKYGYITLPNFKYIDFPASTEAHELTHFSDISSNIKYNKGIRNLLDSAYPGLRYLEPHAVNTEFRNDVLNYQANEYNIPDISSVELQNWLIDKLTTEDLSNLLEKTSYGNYVLSNINFNQNAIKDAMKYIPGLIPAAGLYYNQQKLKNKNKKN